MFEKVVSCLIQVGTTTSCYYSSIHLGASKILAKVCHQTGQREFVGKCNMDRNDLVDQYKDILVEHSVEDTIQFINFVRKECSSTCHQKMESKSPHCTTAESSSNVSPRVALEQHEDSNSLLVQPIITPRFAISCTDELLGRLGELVKTDEQIRLQTHLTSRALHSIKLLVHCPTSNFNLRSGICQIQKLKAAGFNKLSLGTDVSGGYGVGILSTIRDAALAAKVLSFPDSATPDQASNRPQQLSIENLFYLATLGGACICNLDDRVGNFGLGKRFDGLLIQTGAAAATTLAHQNLNSTGDSVNRRFSDCILASQVGPYLDGSNPNFFVDDQKKEIDLSHLLEKFLFTLT
ncbi:uncharacterized protein PGTG_11142 [Puccinia graminis f. sp. tritici CRL 75-36-700-3]|uniref:Amidohydrolase-related domain-containing protein n=1 Tax=Puccinia graminis f. sp. tritici (strain CRL 75-36-700-3 / race SCCL) TaxID=418459 RepID=E3KMW4_PUCGT|nr:uncharacterized protein PGTG_11142 [Puccinia graminis f. sp. tritici CRL 75-36-700-3]EFP85813.2 hypothetical protein PGTG_11142 [Puccinia graminis f. sp. tritici CRL 75-36-700-3]